MATSNSTGDNHVHNVAIVGAGGHIGENIVKALVSKGTFTIKALTREGSTTTMPDGLSSVDKVDYESPASLAAALKGQDVLVVTLGIMATPETQMRPIDAAIEAGVKYILPNEWGVDLDKTDMNRDTFMADRYLPAREHIKQHGGDKTHFIGVCCGFWYEFSLAGTEARYGFDFEKKEVTLFSGGNVKINTTTWPQVGRAVANLLSLKVAPDGKGDDEIYLSRWNNRAVNISSFFVSQTDMFESVLRVTGDKKSDWTVKEEDTVQRYNRGLKLMQEGNLVGYGYLLYARGFYDDGSGSQNDKLDNDRLSLEPEDIDQATKVAIDMAARGETNALGA